MEEFHRKIRSFVRREGRMTAGQTAAYEELMPVYGLEYEKQKLDLAQLFGNQNPVVLEIGFGMGASLAEQATKNPDKNFFGIEVHRPGVGSLLARIKEPGATNVRVIAHDAIEVLEHMISDASLDKVQLFFPDPWPKKRHHKRRIVKSDFVQQLRTKLKNGGIFHMATDWENYAEHMLGVMQAESGWQNLSENNDYVPRPDDRPVTKFQARGERLGHGVWDLMFTKTEG
ncbi:MAG: tRNA (guanosine(46)-N7)-methyltransferase TrmB [Kangiellaceae bacterium]|nr:tRNA (guanosine(46)-N7)-methyltransferase TrmB [Kangiellaceae bacterium]